MNEDYFSAATCFVGTDTGEKDDYLSLEVCFCYDKEKEDWIFDEINSEAVCSMRNDIGNIAVFLLGDPAGVHAGTKNRLQKKDEKTSDFPIPCILLQ